MVAWIYDGSDWGALIQHGIGTIVSSELAPLLYRDTDDGLAENTGLSDPQYPQVIFHLSVIYIRYENSQLSDHSAQGT